VKQDAENDIMGALAQWVEKGVAPDKIIATKFKNDDRSQGVARTRPVCPYPQVAKYNGSGSIDDAANFVCANPGPALSESR
jgi:feruloyl esterase